MKRIVLFVAPMVAILAVVGLALGFLVIRRPGRQPIEAVLDGAAEALPEISA